MAGFAAPNGPVNRITPLRQRMLDDMKLCNMAVSTRRIYVASVAGFNAYHGRSPDELTLEDVRDYQLHLVARGLKARCSATIRIGFTAAIRKTQLQICLSTLSCISA